MDTRRVPSGQCCCSDPSTAAGREWDTVFIVGVQEAFGQIRDCADSYCAQGLSKKSHRRSQPLAERIAQVRHDELRTLRRQYASLRRLIGTAVADADHQPSCSSS